MRTMHPIPIIYVAWAVLSPGDLPADEKGDLWTAARKVFERSCFPCHGAGQRAASDFFVLKPEELSGNVKAVEKRVLESKGESRMPPSSYRKSFEDKYGVSREAYDGLQLKEGDAAAIRKWIDGGAPIVEAKKEAAEFIRDDEVIAAIHDDVLALPEENRKFARYLSLANLLRAGDGPGDLALYRNGIRKLLASLTWRQWGVEVVVVEKTKGTVLRFDYRHLWYSPTFDRRNFAAQDVSFWEGLARLDPYELPFFGEKALRIQRELGTRHVFLRADWFAFQVTQPAVYARTLGIPGVLRDHPLPRLERFLLGIDPEEDIHQGKVARAGTTNSGVSVNHRIIERHALGEGYYWVSYDFRAPAGTSNILEFPIGPELTYTPLLADHPNFKHAGGEFIFSLPDGMQGYYLANAFGEPLETAPTDIVQNPRSRDAVVQNGISCMECHAQGMRPTREDMDRFADQLRPYVEATAEDAKVLETVERLHPGTAEVRRLIEEDRKRFEAALGRLGLEEAVDANGRKIDAEPIFHLVDRFQQKVDSVNAAAELGMTAEELSKQFNSPFLRNNRTMRQLAARLKHTRVSRDEFVAEFEKLRALMGGSPAVESNIPEPGKNFTLVIADPDVKIELIWIPPGKFSMGSPEDEAGRGADERLHEVTITKGFWLGKTEVTQRQFELVVGTNSSSDKSQNPDFPANLLGAADEALDFCRGLKSRVRKLPEGYQFSLPTEAQWEYACRAGTSSPIPGPSLDATAWHQANSGGQLHPGGQKQANPWGLQDMIGNVWEWCADGYAEYPSGAVTDPEAPRQNGSDGVYRGGNFEQSAGACRCAQRVQSNIGVVLASPGFRVCLRAVK
jgi:formylglycine-generating enzyme required for sulfatase activity/mono/diheme cytochrome c family protein